MKKTPVIVRGQESLAHPDVAQECISISLNPFGSKIQTKKKKRRNIGSGRTNFYLNGTIPGLTVSALQTLSIFSLNGNNLTGTLRVNSRVN